MRGCAGEQPQVGPVGNSPHQDLERFRQNESEEDFVFSDCSDVRVSSKNYKTRIRIQLPVPATLSPVASTRRSSKRRWPSLRPRCQGSPTSAESCGDQGKTWENSSRDQVKPNLQVFKNFQLSYFSCYCPWAKPPGDSGSRQMVPPRSRQARSSSWRRGLR